MRSPPKLLVQTPIEQAYLSQLTFSIVRFGIFAMLSLELIWAIKMATDLDQRPKLFSKEVTDVPNFVIPDNLGTLSDLWTKAKISPIHELEQGYLGSGSNVTQTQYLALRIIHASKNQKPGTITRFLKRYGLDDVWKDATNRVAQSTEYRAYISLIRMGISIIDLPKDHPSYPGSFKPVKRVQEQIAAGHDVDDQPERETRSANHQLYKVTKSEKSKDKGGLDRLKRTLKDSHFNGLLRKPSKRDSALLAKQRISAQALEQSEGPPIPKSAIKADEPYVDRYYEALYETTPNAALILLLQGVSELVEGSGLEWTFDHIHLKASFDKGSFNTWTDGALQTRGGQDILAIVEVKKRLRERKEIEILMQEGAEMVAWLMRENGRLPDLNGQWVALETSSEFEIWILIELHSHVLISQDCDKIWVTFASCHPDYIEYIKRKGKITGNTFLKMQTFGPFDVNNAEHMESLAVLITAIPLKDWLLCLLGVSIPYSSFGVFALLSFLQFVLFSTSCVAEAALYGLFNDESRHSIQGTFSKLHCVSFRRLNCLYRSSSLLHFVIFSVIFVHFVLQGPFVSNYSTREASI